MSIAVAANQAIWLWKLMTDFGEDQVEHTIIMCANKSSIAIANNPVQRGQTKHVKVKYHSIREAEKNQEVKLVHCKSELQIVDILKKPLPKSRFEELRCKLVVSEKSLKEEC